MIKYLSKPGLDLAGWNFWFRYYPTLTVRICPEQPFFRFSDLDKLSNKYSLQLNVYRSSRVFFLKSIRVLSASIQRNKKLQHEKNDNYPGIRHADGVHIWTLFDILYEQTVLNHAIALLRHGCFQYNFDGDRIAGFHEFAIDTACGGS